ncbi:serine hydrolase domain-containing protein [Patiriisocius sp. Uisw_017]|jgi:CubicO group peptidase (beta-lactamase class C family)|uniref:serine hydrolase domain-containing protein n=1 Tax=Patiriisocius sp. Uisw_017 TaxID=3230968 RepID=UPI0039EB3655
MKYLKWLFGFLLLLIVFAYITDYNYIFKGVRVVYLTGHTTAFIADAKYFENDTIPASANPQAWPLHKNYNTLIETERLKTTNEDLGTVALLVIKNDSILFEKYAEGYSATSRTNSFSMAKSITTILLGAAIKDGYISSLNQPVRDFYPQFEPERYEFEIRTLTKDKVPYMTVGDLSSMASGLNWEESYTSPFSVTARSYYDDNLAETILGLKVIQEPGKHFEYLSGNTQLLGMTIEKATNKKIAAYLQESLYEPMGFEQPATWQVDDAENRLAKTYCCIASSARDFARFGRLFKNFGNWNGQQIIDSSFVAKAIKPRFENSPEYGYGFWISNYMDKDIFVMRGILGQYVITIPEDNLIIVRLGHQRGSKKGKPFSDDFYTYVSEVFKMLK